jgi:hypothetical protein
MAKVDSELILAERMRSYAADPLGWVRYVFPWGLPGDLEDESGPRNWQSKVLDEVGEAIRSGSVPDMPFLYAVASGHGVGKSALVSWLVLWAMSTMEGTKCVVTATTEAQLRTKTWSELSKWHNMMINSHWFRYTATKLCFAESEAEETWKADAVTWSDSNTIAFQGLHNKGRRIVVIFDEASGIDDGVWDVTEGALTDADTEIFWFAFGNPNHNTGRFDGCWKMYRNQWKTLRLDSRKVEGANLKQIEQWENLYGVDHDFFRVRVMGLPPKGEGGNLIGQDSVEAAMGRTLPAYSYDFAPMIIGVDPAWTGRDHLEIVARQGNMCWLLRSIPKNDNDVVIADIIEEYQTDLNADAVFIDGGFGTGIISIGKSRGYKNWHIVWFSGKTHDPECINLRAKMWKDMRDWIKDGGCLPDNEDLKQDLISVDRKARDDGKLQLESKDEMKKKHKLSPNKGDALALTFAAKVMMNSEVGMLDRIVYESEWD